MKIAVRILLRFVAILSLALPAYAQSNTFIYPEDKVDLSPRQSSAVSDIRALKTTQDLQIVRVDAKSLLADKQLQVLSKFQSEYTIKNTSRDTLGDKLVSWSGQAADLVPGTSTVIINDNNVTASIQTDNGLYRIRPIGGGLHAFVKVNTAEMPTEHPPSFNEKSHGLRDVPPFDRKSDSDTSTTTISVLVAYTPAVEKKLIDIKGFVQLAFAETNQSYVNSGVHINLVPAPVEPILVSFNETGNMDDEVSAFSKLPLIQQIRATNHSNVAVLLVADNSYCGQALQILATKQTAYALVYYDCATGYYSFGHEIGHLQGARHNPQEDPDNSPFPYGHGFMDPTRKRRTIMSYDCPSGGCQRMPEWARPTDWGNVSVSNDAKVLNETSNYIAGFR